MEGAALCVYFVCVLCVCVCAYVRVRVCMRVRVCVCAGGHCVLRARSCSRRAAGARRHTAPWPAAAPTQVVAADVLPRPVTALAIIPKRAPPPEAPGTAARLQHQQRMQQERQGQWQRQQQQQQQQQHQQPEQAQGGQRAPAWPAQVVGMMQIDGRPMAILAASSPPAQAGGAHSLVG